MKYINKLNYNYLLYFLCIISAIITYLQVGRILPLVDYTYQLESAYRIFYGEVPYKDFILVLTPGTYYLMAIIMKVFGKSNIYQIIFVMIISFLTIFFSYKILDKFNNNKLTNLILVLPLIFCGYTIYPYPSYDINAIFFILIAIFAIINIINSESYSIKYIIVGILIVIPILFKQNIGIIFLISSLLVLFLTNVFSKQELSNKSFLSIIAGSIISIIVIFFVIYFYFGHEDFFYQIFRFPSQTRPLLLTLETITFQFFKRSSLFFYATCIIGLILLKVSIEKFLKIKKQILYIGFLFFIFFTIPIIINIYNYYNHQEAWSFYRYIFSIWHLIIIVALIFLIYIIYCKKQNKICFIDLLPIIPIAVITSTFLSQGLMGSTYGTWPMFIILFALVMAKLNQFIPFLEWRKLFSLISAFLMIFMAIYAFSNARIKFVPYDGEYHNSTYKHFEKLGTPGPWIPEMENMFNIVNKDIPQDDTIFTIPGEDPLFFALNRKHVLPYFQLNSITMPFTPEKIMMDCQNKQIKWIIFKNNCQMPTGFIDTKIFLPLIRAKYILFKSIKGYDIYKLNQ